MAKVTWLGDDDPSANTVTVGDYTFVKGVAVDVPDKDLGKVKDNPMFSTEAGAKATQANEPAEEDREELAERGTVKAALKAQLRDQFGVTIQGNPSEDTLRARLAKEIAKDDEK